MKEKLKSLRVHMLLPVIAMSLFIVIMLTTFFSRAFINMILTQEQQVNAAGFETISQSLVSLVNTAVIDVRRIMSDDRVAEYAGLEYSSTKELIQARIDCRDYMRSEITQSDKIYGLLVMRKDGSLFGTLPEGNFFLDDPHENPLPDAMRTQILNASLGETVWIGPVSGAFLYGFENANTPKRIMIAASKSVDVRYGECYGLLLIDESIFEKIFTSIQNGTSNWYLFTPRKTEIYHTGEESCMHPDRLINESNTGKIFDDDDGNPICTFSMTLTSPPWTMLRKVDMDDYELLVKVIRRVILIIAGVIHLFALALYHFWLKKFMFQFNTLLQGITRMGEGDLKPSGSASFTIGEFETMQQEIDRTSVALKDQMDTIRRMEREKMEQESLIREQEHLQKELSTARQIQTSVLPHIFPPFPERDEIELFASMDPAKDVGGDFYDFYFIDADHLCLVIADVSGKGIPGALFMMFSKRIIMDYAKIEHSVSDILIKANEVLCDNNTADMFVTVWLGILEISTGKLTTANAGHEYPAIRKADGKFVLHKDKHGFVIGGIPSVRYKEFTLQMEPGDKIFVYTDGVPEATAASGEMFGLERMTDALNTCADGSPDEILRTVKSAVDEFVGDAEPFDDMTMMCLEYKGVVE